MNKTKLIVLCTVCALMITLLCVGITNKAVLIEPTTPPEHSHPSEPTLPDEPRDEVQLGKYYCVAGTIPGISSMTISLNGIETLLKYNLPCLTIDSENQCMWVSGHSTDWVCSNGVFTFADNGAFITDNYTTSVEHDDAWYEANGGRKDAPFECTYNKDEKLIIMTHNSDTLYFKYFASNEEAKEYFMQYAIDGYIDVPEHISEYQTQQTTNPTPSEPTTDETQDSDATEGAPDK